MKFHNLILQLDTIKILLLRRNNQQLPVEPIQQLLDRISDLWSRNIYSDINFSDDMQDQVNNILMLCNANKTNSNINYQLYTLIEPLDSILLMNEFISRISNELNHMEASLGLLDDPTVSLSNNNTDDLSIISSIAQTNDTDTNFYFIGISCLPIFEENIGGMSI